MIIFYAIALVGGAVSRGTKMTSRLEFYLEEVQNHPENAAGWSNVAIALMEKGPSHVAGGKPFLERGKRLDPKNPNVLSAEFLYYFHMDDLSAARESLGVIEPLYQSNPQALARFHFHHALMEERAGNASEAALAYLRAVEREPQSQLYREAYEKAVAKK